jgi:hypothetical protein
MDSAHPVLSCARFTGWTGHPYYIFIDKELPTEAVMNATRDATNGKAQWHLIDESVGWGKPDW